MAIICTRLDKSDPENDDVGYGRPPKKHRWKEGQSGNPSGKRKKPDSTIPPADDLASLVATELLTPTKVLKGGKAQDLSKFEILAANLVAQLISAKTSRETIGLIKICEQLGVFAKVGSLIQQNMLNTSGPWTPDLEARFWRLNKKYSRSAVETSLTAIELQTGAEVYPVPTP